jgi:hypothetical protein
MANSRPARSTPLIVAFWRHRAAPAAWPPAGLGCGSRSTGTASDHTRAISIFISGGPVDGQEVDVALRAGMDGGHRHRRPRPNQASGSPTGCASTNVASESSSRRTSATITTTSSAVSFPPPFATVSRSPGTRAHPKGRSANRREALTGRARSVLSSWSRAQLLPAVGRQRLTRRSDELARVDLFDRRSQLLVYHFMFGPTVDLTQIRASSSQAVPGPSTVPPTKPEPVAQ